MCLGSDTTIFWGLGSDGGCSDSSKKSLAGVESLLSSFGLGSGTGGSGVFLFVICFIISLNPM
jgi:hypothetical protein